MVFAVFMVKIVYSKWVLLIAHFTHSAQSHYRSRFNNFKSLYFIVLGTQAPSAFVVNDAPTLYAR
jgi:hypothetical protein